MKLTKLHIHDAYISKNIWQSFKVALLGQSTNHCYLCVCLSRFKTLSPPPSSYHFSILISSAGWLSQNVVKTNQYRCKRVPLPEFCASMSVEKTSEFSLRQQNSWYVQIQASLQLVQIWVSVICLMSIKEMEKPTVGSWQDIPLGHFVPEVAWHQLCCGFWGSGFTNYYSVLFHLLQSFSLLCLLYCNYQETNWLSVSSNLNTLLPYFTCSHHW